MTPTRYLLARIGQAFGYVRRAQRMADAASEMHLLREAEAYLGEAVWDKVENIEALSVEYWNLRKLIKEHDGVQAKLVACQERLDRAHEERAALLNSTPETSEDLLDRRAALLVELEGLAIQRDQIVADAREVRRAFVGLKMKLEVLTNEARGTDRNDAEIAKVKERLGDLKQRFSELKQERIRIGLAIDEGDARVDAVDDKLKQEKQQRRELASQAFQVIGEGNKEISLLRAEGSLLATRMRQLYAEIGRHVSRHAISDPACAAAAASHHGMVEVMRALRRSVALNHRLAEAAAGERTPKEPVNS
jgi:chromosome segregation ATPase